MQANGIMKQAKNGILISDKKDFKIKLIRRDKKEPQFIDKNKFNQENITIFNIFAPNSSAPNFIQSILMKLNA